MIYILIYRLTPVNAAILAFIATMLFYLGTGPHWQLMVGNMREGCRLNWWNNLLYIHNYIDHSPPVYNILKICSYNKYDLKNKLVNIYCIYLKCMGETWYLACDMQMFWLSPLLIYPLWRWHRAGRAWVLAVTAVLIVATLAVYYIEFNFPPTDMFAIRQLVYLAYIYSRKLTYYPKKKKLKLDNIFFKYLDF